MKRRKKVMKGLALSLVLSVFCPLLSVFSCSVAYAENSGAAFLKIGVGARPIGMGGAFVAVADDANAVFWNPAGLSQLNKRQLGAMHTEWIDDLKYDYVGYVHPLGKIQQSPFSNFHNVIGVSVVYLSMGDMEKRDAERQKTGSFSAYDACVIISYSKSLGINTSLGINLKLIEQKIEDERAHGIAIDIGQIYKTPMKHLNLGLAVQNIGPDMKFIEEPYSLPLTIAVGAGYRLLGGLTLGLDVKHQVIDNRTSISFGTEYLPVRVLALRAGYLTRLLSAGSNTKDIQSSIKGIEALAGLGAGLGFRLGSTAVDYAFVPYGDLGNTHRISLIMKF